MKFKDILEWTNFRLWAVLCSVWFVAVWIRWDYLDLVEINSDSLSPYLSALRFWRLGYSTPPNPESDHWMWISKIPWLWCASSLEELFSIRFIIGASIAPMGAWCAFHLSDRLRYSSALFCGLILAADKGLIDTLVSSYRGYMAPEWIALSTIFVVLSRRYTWAIPFVGMMVIIAGGHHPMALGGLLGVVLLFLFPIRRGLVLWVSILCVGLVSLFRLLSLYEILQCDAGGLACIQSIALGSSEDISFWSVCIRILHDRFWVEMGFSGIFVVMGFFFARKDSFFRWGMSSIMGIFILGICIDTLRPYHFRIVVVPMMLIAVLGWQKFGRWAWLIWSIWLMGICFGTADIIGVERQIEKHDRLANEIMTFPDGLWLESASGSGVFTPAVGLSAILSGVSHMKFASENQGDILVLWGEGVPKMVSISEIDLLDIEFGGGHDWATSIYRSDSVKTVEK
jgi:hypothetical protein